MDENDESMERRQRRHHVKSMHLGFLHMSMDPHGSFDSAPQFSHVHMFGVMLQESASRSHFDASCSGASMRTPNRPKGPRASDLV